MFSVVCVLSYWTASSSLSCSCYPGSSCWWGIRWCILLAWASACSASAAWLEPTCWWDDSRVLVRLFIQIALTPATHTNTHTLTDSELPSEVWCFRCSRPALPRSRVQPSPILTSSLIESLLVIKYEWELGLVYRISHTVSPNSTSHHKYSQIWFWLCCVRIYMRVNYSQGSCSFIIWCLLAFEISPFAKFAQQTQVISGSSVLVCNWFYSTEGHFLQQYLSASETTL